MTKQFASIIPLVSVMFFSGNAFSQIKDSTGGDPNLTKVVHVVTEYEPSVSDANRLAGMPELVDTQAVKPVFKYSIVSKPIHKYFEVTPITAAKMKAEPLNRLYRGLFIGALGNYMSTLANLNLSSIRSKKSFITAELNHQGSFMDVKVNDIKQPSSVSNNMIKISGKRFLDKKEVYGTIATTYDMFHAYGFPATVKQQIDAESIKKAYTGLQFQTGIRTLNLDSGKINYDIKPHVNFFDANADKEISAGLSNYVEKLMNEQSLAAKLDLTYYGGTADKTTEIMFNPFGSLNTETLKGKVGFSTQVYAGDYKKFHLYPDVYAEYNVAEYVFVPFIRCNGYSRWSGLEQLAAENPYISDGLSTTPENNKINVDAGIKGLISQTLPYSLSGTYSRVENMHLFVTDNVSLENTYNVLLDTVDVMNFHSELGFKKLEKINLTFKFDYFSYSNGSQPSAWQKPEVITTLNFLWNLQNKILFNIDVFYVGDRQAYSLKTAQQSKAKAFVDANFGVEYRYTKRISAFVNLNNITSQNYQYWNNTPVQRFNALFGFSYAFWGE